VPATPQIAIDFDESTVSTIEALRRLVETESPSSDIPACERCADAVAALGYRLLGAEAERLSLEGRPHLRWRFGAPRVLLLGHFDTVWPLGTIRERPFTVDGDVATGPGVFDMKAGVVQLLYAVAGLDQRDGIEILLTSDEEIASPTSRSLIQHDAKQVLAALVLEPSQEGALKIARKGISQYTLRFHGIPAHAGLEPEKGASALSELARTVPLVEAIADPHQHTTVTPTLARAGIAVNVVPPEAELHVDVRTATAAEQDRVDRAMHDLAPQDARVRIDVDGGPDRPPLEPERSAALFDRARRIATSLGFELRGVAVGGGSDGNITAATGTDTLDGLGAVGDGAHAPHEQVRISQMPVRTELVRRLMEELLA